MKSRLSDEVATGIILVALVTVMLSIALSFWVILVWAISVLVVVAIIVHEGKDDDPDHD